MRRSVFFLCFVFFAVVAVAVPAKRGVERVRLSDGSFLSIERHGDEFFHYTTTMDGFQIEQSGDGFYYYYQDSQTRGSVKVRATDPSDRGAEQRRYVSTIARGVNAEYRVAGMAAGDRLRQSLGASTRVAAGAAANLAKRGLVIVAQFADTKLQAKHTKASFEALLNQKGYNAYGGTGSAKDYYTDNSRGIYSPTFDVGAVVTLPQPMNFYGQNNILGTDDNAQQMVIDACTAADGQVNFRDYDTNGDGKVDNVFIYYAGYNEAERGPANSIWPHRHVVLSGLTFDGVQIYDYACTSELRGSAGTKLAGIGTFTHEFGHVLGLSDMYDTDGDVEGKSSGLYDLSVMSSGSYLNDGCTPPYYNCLERSLLGWITIQDMEIGELVLDPIEKATRAWRLPTANNKEYYLIESRGTSGWDAHLGGYGLLIYHVDRSDNMAGLMTASMRWSANRVNSAAGKECAKVIEGIGGTSFNMLNQMDLFYPGSAKNSNFLISSYGATDNTGVPIMYELTGITPMTDGATKLNVRAAAPRISIGGRVYSEGVPIAGATVKLVSRTGAAKATAAFAATKVAVDTRLSWSEDVQTSSDGSFTIHDVPQSDYLIQIEKSGYDVMVEPVTVDQGWGSPSFEIKAVPTRICEGVSWLKTLYYLINMIHTTDSNSPRVAAIWDTQDLASMRMDTISAIKVYTGTSSTMEVVVSDNHGGLLYKATVAATATNNYTTLRIPEGALTVPVTGEMRVELRFDNPRIFIGADNGPAVRGKGDQISYNDGKTWGSITDDDIDVNFAIVMEKYKRTNDLSQPTITSVQPRQRDISFTVRSTDSNIKGWKLRYRATSDTRWIEKSTDVPIVSIIELSDLEPQTEYQIELFTIFADRLSPAIETKATTKPLTAPFAAIEAIQPKYIVGAKYTPMLTNLSSAPVNVEWKLDDKKLVGGSFIFDSAGTFTLLVTITYADRSTEVITRQITVQ